MNTLRSKISTNKNLLKPCLIVDNTDFIKDAVYSTSSMPTNKDSELIFTDLSPYLSKYQNEYSNIIDSIWEEEYASYKEV